MVAIEELQGKNSSQHIKDLCSFLKIKKLNIPIKNNNTSKLSFESKAKLKNFYDPFNKILYKIIKREIKEWEDD